MKILVGALAVLITVQISNIMLQWLANNNFTPAKQWEAQLYKQGKQ
jgi:hypothetical protein